MFRDFHYMVIIGCSVGTIRIKRKRALLLEGVELFLLIKRKHNL